jgi:hypothetical protein
MSLFERLLGRELPPERAPAEVLAATKTTSRMGQPTGTTYAYLWKVEVRIEPETEAPFETTLKEYFAWETAPDVGARFTARYRPGSQKGAKVDHDVPGIFTAGADVAPEAHRYGYKHRNGGIPAVMHDEPQYGITIDLRNPR